MSETHDPWKDVKPFKLMLLSDLQSGATEAALYHASEVDAAHAAEATQHQQEIAAKDEHIAVVEGVLREHSEFGGLFQPGGRFHRVANLRLGGSAVADGGRWLVARLAAVEAERDEKDRQVAAVYADVDRLTNQKRALEAERDRLKAALSQITALDFEKFNGRHNFYSGAVMFVKAWLLAYAALSGEGTAKP